MRYVIRIEADDAALEEYPEVELARILRTIASKVEAGIQPATNLRDVNGNTVGYVAVIQEQDPE